jgi:hypothetical protein
MNTSQRGQVAQGGIILPSYTDLIPESRVAHATKEAKQEAYAKAFARIAASLHYQVYQSGIPTWEALTEDSVKLLALQALNMIMLADRAQINQERAHRNRQMEKAEKAKEPNPFAQNAVQAAPTSPQLVRTVSAPVNEGLRLIGQSPVRSPTQTITVTAGGALVIQPGQYNQAIQTMLSHAQKEHNEKVANSQGEAAKALDQTALQAGYLVQRRSPQPGSSTQVVTALIKAPGSPNQEQQGRTTQTVSLKDIQERVRQIQQAETLKTIANKSLNIKKLTRAQLNKLTNDPKIKDQVLSHFST